MYGFYPSASIIRQHPSSGIIHHPSASIRKASAQLLLFQTIIDMVLMDVFASVSIVLCLSARFTVCWIKK